MTTTGTMWAQTVSSPGRLTTYEVPIPSVVPPGHVLLRTVAGGICGSDLPAFRGAASPATRGAPGIGGVGYPLHEIVGDVVETSDEGFAVGGRVVGWASAHDALAEYVLTTTVGLHTYREPWSPEVAITLQPLACVLSAVEHLGPVAGASVAVLGQGPIGLLFSHVVHAAGARKVVGVDRLDRSGLATTYGIDTMLHVATDRWVAELAEVDRPDVVIEAIGHQASTIGHSVDAVRLGGRILYFGVPDDDLVAFPLRTFLRKNLTLVASVALERRRFLVAAEAYLREHPELARHYVTDVFPAAEAEEAFRRACAPHPEQVKVVLTMA